MRTLIINADDFGLSVGINKGIMRGYHMGVVTSTSAMVNFPAWEHGVKILMGNPGLGVGVHINLSRGYPVSRAAEINSLVNREGMFHGNPELLLQANPEHVLREMEAQYRRFVLLRRKLPTHLDSHHHIHCLPGFDKLFAGFAAERGLPMGFTPRTSGGRPLGVRVPDALVWQFFDRGANQLNFARLVEGCAPGITEFMCHPGKVDGDLANWSGYTWQRERELAVICSYTRDNFRAKFNIELANFQSLA